MKSSPLRASIAGLVGALAVVAACSSSDDAAAPGPGERDGGGGGPGGEGGGGTTDPRRPGAEAGAADGPPIFVDAGPPGVDFIGRFDRRENAGPICAWPGCRILARFEGTSVAVTLDERSFDWMDGTPSEWDVSVDDAAPTRLVTKAGVQKYPIAKDLAPGPHTVELYKRNEAQVGFTQFRGFDLGGGKLLSPPAKSVRHLEIVADSSAAGFGVEGVGYPDNDCPGIDYGARWQNFRKSFGAIVGATLLAEVHGTVYSGKGLVKNVWRPDTETMPSIYGRANPLQAGSDWDFSWKADVVVVMIGGNDFAFGQPSEAGGGGPATPAQFTDGYRSFVRTLREKPPVAQLLLTPSPSASDAEPAGRNTRTNILQATNTVAAERNAAGDAKVHAFHPNPAPSSELTACNGHGTPQFHQRVAAELATVVKQKTGW